MTDDLIEQLRLEKRTLTWRAADVIERLTRERDIARATMSHALRQADVAIARAERSDAELAAEREKAFTAMRVFERYRELEAQIAETTTRAEAAERKVEKLRVALKECVAYFARNKICGRMSVGARAALKETESE